MKKKLLLVLMMSLMLSVCMFVTACGGLELVPNHKVSFDTLGYGTIETQEREEGQLVKMPEAPVREGYTFVGWTLNGELHLQLNKRFFQTRHFLTCLQ